MKFNQKFFCVVFSLLSFFVTGSASAQIAQSKGDPHTPDKWPTSQALASCPDDALEADIVAIDHPIVFNRLGAQNVNWMMYALQHDIIDLASNKTLDPDTNEGRRLFEKARKNKASRGIALRPDLRPRPLVLRVATGGHLKVRFTNLLHGRLKHYPFAQPNYANPFDYLDPLKGINHPLEHAPENAHKDTDTGYSLSISDLHKIYTSDDQVASRYVGFHPQGLELVTSIDDDSSYVGKNKNSLAPPAPGETKTYCFRAEKEGAYLVSSDGAVFGGEGTAGNSGVGLFGAVIVEPKAARFYRAQVTEEEMRLATRDEYTEVSTKDGKEVKRIVKVGDKESIKHPVINYEALYPDDCATNGVWCQEGKAGKPILNMVQNNRIIHGDINAMIIGPNDDGSFDCATYPLEGKNESACQELTKLKHSPEKDQKILERISKLNAQIERNPTLPNRLEPFREFVSIFHDENAATQAFPYFFEHPELGHTLHGVRDAFMINYGSGGVGAEIIANRLKAGPMHDCLDCAYEEFFLSSFAVGDAAMLVDKPANLVINQCQPEYVQMVREDPADPNNEKEILDPRYANERDKFCTQTPDQRATEAYYPHDPANVHHSYIGDFVKFRNMHSGKEQHIFHLHNHQWLFNPNDDNSNYIDAQGIGPGSGYTYEIAFGGSGNRNKTVGDAIFHCHFYPHFAQGMWYLWRNHDVFEAGTRLAASDESPDHFHAKPFALMSGKPSNAARALPDGEIVAGVPIPAIVPLPGKGMAPMPIDVSVKPRKGRLDNKDHGSVAEVNIPKKLDTKTESTKSNTNSPPNPGYPFWVAGASYYLEDGKEMDKDKVSIGSRPTTPPLDMSEVKNKAGEIIIEGHHGGLPRHALAGYSAEGETESKLNRFNADKVIIKAMPVYYDEQGTKLERMSMDYHAVREHVTHKIDRYGNVSDSFFTTNGASRIPGAPFNDPCMDDLGNLLQKDGDGQFFGGVYDQYINAKSSLPEGMKGIEYGADNPRVYKGANIQLDVVFNKLGYHYPQQRILALWEDVVPLLYKEKAPEPLVLRMNTFDCAMYAHTNLVPHLFFADDYQITTPTDVIGQHIHLPKWDLTSADGSANGWNYEDGTFSPGMMRQRIFAINAWIKSVGKKNEKEFDVETLTPREPEVHPHFNSKIGLQLANCVMLWKEMSKKKNLTGEDLLHFEREYGIPGKCDWLGARTTLQRWFSDPIVNRHGIHRGLGTTFTHDHLGPSTHQQLGLYATMLTEPPGSKWQHNETGEELYTRADGGPTSWQAVIVGKDGAKLDIDKDEDDDSHREFFLQFGDFQHAYVKGAYYGVNRNGVGWLLEKPSDPNKPKNPEDPPSAKPTPDSFRFAINPSVRKPAQPVFPDILAFEPTCPGGKGSEVLSGAIYNVVTDFNDLSLYNKKGQPLRPCPEAISADDIGMMVVNYRNEPIGARVYDPDKRGPDGKKGTQADGKRGDLAFAMQTMTNRAIPILNTQYGHADFYEQPLTKGVFSGDPFTPILRANSGDKIKIKIQAGSHEHEHNASINGLSWLQGGSGYGQAPHSGWRNSQNAGLSEQFTFQASLIDYETPLGISDRMYTIDSSQDGLWNGVWGVLRSYSKNLPQDDPNYGKLLPLPNNESPTVLALDKFNKDDPFERLDNVCPSDAPIRSYKISAVLANKVLSKSVPPSNDKDWKIQIPKKGAKDSNLNPDGGTLIYNPRATEISIEILDESGKVIEIRKYGTGPLHDPTAIMFVLDTDLNSAGKLKPNAPLEPLVLRAAAGECIHITLRNQLPRDPDTMPDLDGYTSLSGIIPRNCSDLGHLDRNKRDCERLLSNPDASVMSFNNNLIRPSNHIGLHPQMAHYDVQASDGNNIGLNSINTVPPGKSRRYSWYAGTVEVSRNMDMAKNNSCAPELADAHLFNKFSIPYQIALNALDITISDDPDDFIKSLLTLLDYKIVGGYRSGEDGNATPKISNLYADWRDKKDSLETFRNFIGDRGSIGFINELIESYETFHERFWSTMNKKFLSFTDRACLNSIREELKVFYQPNVSIEERENQLLFDRGKILYFMDRVAGCRGGQPMTIPYQSIATNLKPLEKTNFIPVERRASIARIESTNNCKARFVPIEYGGSNLTPPDRIKQGQKGAIGALVIEPEGASWTETDQVADRQQHPNAEKINLRYTRTMADVVYRTATGERKFRDLVMVHQKGLNLRYKDGSAIANLAAEKEKAGENPTQTAPEDAHDSGHMAINYGAEPLWFRFGLPPDAPFGKSGFGGVGTAWQAFSNDCCSNGKKVVTAHIAEDGVFRVGTRIGTVISADQPVGEPYVPIMKAYAGQEMRIRSVMPTGVGRASTVELHGHSWMRDPYLAEYVEEIEYDDADEKNNRIKRKHSFPRGGNQYGFYDEEGKSHPGWGTSSKCIGENALAMHLGGQESLTPMAHFDLIFPRAGGKHGVKGDYLWRDHGGFGITNGLWALIRVEDAPEKAGYGGFGPETLRTNCHVVAANTVSP